MVLVDGHTQNLDPEDHPEVCIPLETKHHHSFPKSKAIIFVDKDNETVFFLNSLFLFLNLASCQRCYVDKVKRS